MTSTQVFDNRETAILIWLGVLLIWGFSSHKLRPSFTSVAKSLIAPKVFSVFALMAMYVSSLVYLLWLAKIWTVDVLGDTIFWFFGPAVVLLFKMNEQKGDSPFFRRTLLELLSFTVVFEFVVNVYPLPLIAEVVLIPFLVLIGGMAALAASKPEYSQVKTFVTDLTLLVGLSFLAYALYRIVQEPSEFASLGTARKFLVPLLLTAGLVPFVYLAAVLFSYGIMLAMLSWKLGKGDLYQHARWRALRAAKLRLSTVRRFATTYPAALVKSSSREEAERAATRIKKQPRGTSSNK